MTLPTADTFVAVNSPTGETSAVINYGQQFNISFIYENAEGVFPELLHNGSRDNLILQVDPTNDQVYHHLVQGLSFDGGVYTLTNPQQCKWKLEMCSFINSAHDKNVSTFTTFSCCLLQFFPTQVLVSLSLVSSLTLHEHIIIHCIMHCSSLHKRSVV